MKGPNRGLPLSPRGLDEVLRGARRRAGLTRGTCHELRHTCLTRLREAGISLEAIQAQAGHRSIESTRIYLHLADGWLADQYREAQEAIDAHESICETCTYYATDTTFRPILQRQRDHAAHHHQAQRVDLFQALLTRLDGTQL